jgi:LysR family transcriptional regulator, regulator of abg operon
MKFSQIRDVVAIVDRGSLRAAAQHLGLAQPALTRSIRELEHELGAPLFERQARGMRLTRLGEAFIHRAKAIQSEVVRAREEFDQLRGLTTGSVTVALSMVSNILFLPAIIKPFQARFPGVRLKIIEGLFPHLSERICDGEIDFYVGPVVDRPLSRAFTLETLFANERVVLGRIGHPLIGVSSLAGLASARWIGTWNSLDRESELGAVFEMHGLMAPRIDIEVTSALSTIMIAATTDLLAMLPRQYLGHPGARDVLAPIEVAERLAAPDMCLIKRSSLPLTPAAEYLADLVQRAALQESVSGAIGATGGR